METLDVTKVEKLECIDPDSFNKTTLTHVQEIKKDFWMISGVCDDSDDPVEASKHAYMFQGDLATKKLSECPVQLFNEMFMTVFGLEMASLLMPYYKFIYIPGR